MNKFTLTAISMAAGLLCSTGAWSASMSKSEYKEARNSIAKVYRSSRSACDAMNGNAKDVCQKEAKGAENIAFADLEANYKPSIETRYKARLAKADAEYEVSKERCDDSVGNAKDVCVQEAKAALVTAKADAKSQRITSEVNHEASDKSAAANAEASEKTNDANAKAKSDKSDAQYKVAKEKCDASVGTAKDLCLDEAKIRHGKS